MSRREHGAWACAAAIAVTLIGCGIDEPDCGPQEFDGHLQSTDYQSDPGTASIKGSSFVHDTTIEKTLTYNATTGVMTISYVRAGQQIVETYRRR
jgi:hypothetical protein